REMSYWVYLIDDNGQPVEVERHSEGGTHVLGGTPTAELNITYNYSKFFRETLGEDGLHELHHQKAGDMLTRLKQAVATLGTERDSDYWKATRGNAGYALSILAAWAQEHPAAVFEVS